jgi:hypothetical protein
MTQLHVDQFHDILYTLFGDILCFSRERERARGWEVDAMELMGVRDQRVRCVHAGSSGKKSMSSLCAEFGSCRPTGYVAGAVS